MDDTIKFRVAPTFLTWMQSIGMPNQTAAIFGRHQSVLELRGSAEVLVALQWLDTIGDQSWYVGHRGASYRGFAARRLAQRIDDAHTAAAFCAPSGEPGATPTTEAP